MKKSIERSATWFQQLISTSAAAGVHFQNQSITNADTHAAQSAFLFGVAQYDDGYPVQLPILMKHMISQGAQGR